MILQSFIELSGIDKYTTVAFHLDVTTQTIYNYLDDPSSMKITTLEKMCSYLKEKSIKFRLGFNKDGRLVFKAEK
jgi:hypothetical protein